MLGNKKLTHSDRESGLGIIVDSKCKFSDQRKAVNGGANRTL